MCATHFSCFKQLFGPAVVLPFALLGLCLLRLEFKPVYLPVCPFLGVMFYPFYIGLSTALPNVCLFVACAVSCVARPYD